MSVLPTSAELGQPDWASVTEQILCPMCDYNLRGISEPRCPECGFVFTWSELLDPTRRRHRFLFEQQEFHRIRAFRKTLIAGLRPKRFWDNDVRPVHPSHPVRLIAYWIIATFIGVAGTIAAAVGPTLVYWYQSNPYSFSSSFSLRHRYFMSLSFGPFDEGATAVLFESATLLFWPLTTIAALMVFRISLRNAKLRPQHVMRCVFYSADCAAWLGLILFPLGIMSGLMALLFLRRGASVPFGPVMRPLGFDLQEFAQWLGVFCILLFGYRLARAYQLYMRFDHAVLTVLCSQIIVMLAVVAAFFNLLAPPQF